MGDNEDKVEVPIVQEEFANFLRKYKVAKGGEMCDTIAENIAETGGANVFENPDALATGLGKWSEYIGAPLRKQILEHWFAKKHIDVSPEALETAGITAKTEAAIKKKKEKEKKEATGALWTVDVDDSGMPRIRMIKDETEPGTTLDEAKAAAAEIGKEREQTIVVYNEELGRHMPNFKSAFVKQNPAAAWATARVMDKAMAEGEPPDPMDVWIDQQVKVAQIKEIMGISPEPREKGTVGEIISGLKQLQEMAKEGKVSGLPEWMSNPVEFIKAVQGIQEMAKEGKVSGLPEWMSNPVEFIKAVQEITGAGEKGVKPDWLSDPAAFIETVRKITPEPKADDTVKTELAELRKTLEDMKEERHKQEIFALASQIKTMQETHAKEMREIVDKMEDIRKPVSGRTEMDILHEVATQGIDTIKTEAAGMRSMIKEVLGSAALPPAKTPREREERKERVRSAIQADQDIEALGRRLFFGEG